jgi:hypothetical protein
MKLLMFFIRIINFSIFLIYPLKMPEIIQEEYHNFGLIMKIHQNLKKRYFNSIYKLYFKEALKHP